MAFLVVRGRGDEMQTFTITSNISRLIHVEEAITKEGGKHMKRMIVSLACALIAPLAFAQTSTTTTDTTRTNPATGTTTETTTTYSAGTVTTYEPGKTIVVKSEEGPVSFALGTAARKSEEGPVSFALGTAARIVDATGKVVTAPLRAGQKVRVYYTGPTEKRVVERVIVED